MRKLFLLLALTVCLGIMLAVPASADVPTGIVDQYWTWYPDFRPDANMPGYWVEYINNIDVSAPEWCQDGFALNIFNIEIPGNVKNIWFEVKYETPQTEIARMFVIDPTGAQFAPIDAWISQNGQIVTWQWQLPWQPPCETICFGSDMFYNLEGIELVEVGTQCVPEPGSLFLLLPGAIGLGAFIRRKK